MNIMHNPNNGATFTVLYNHMPDKWIWSSVSKLLEWCRPKEEHNTGMVNTMNTNAFTLLHSKWTYFTNDTPGKIQSVSALQYKIMCFRLQLVRPEIPGMVASQNIQGRITFPVFASCGSRKYNIHTQGVKRWKEVLCDGYLNVCT